jgi:chromate transport protein ChrA
LVEKLQWMSDEVYGELFALGQFMPGPTSTQVSFAIGIVKKGVKGESALMMQSPLKGVDSVIIICWALADSSVGSFG